MLLTLLLLFTLLPMAEIYLLVRLWDAIGLGPTILIALGTGALGAALARQQGLATLSRLSRQVSAGEPPTDTLVDGAFILLAGAVLITPGVLTDAFGFALLLPPVRAVIKPLLLAALRKRLRRSVTSRGAVYTWGVSDPTAGGHEPSQGKVIDAEVLEVRTRDADA